MIKPLIQSILRREMFMNNEGVCEESLTIVFFFFFCHRKNIDAILSPSPKKEKRFSVNKMDHFEK